MVKTERKMCSSSSQHDAVGCTRGTRRDDRDQINYQQNEFRGCFLKPSFVYSCPRAKQGTEFAAVCSKTLGLAELFRLGTFGSQYRSECCCCCWCCLWSIKPSSSSLKMGRRRGDGIQAVESYRISAPFTRLSIPLSFYPDPLSQHLTSTGPSKTPVFVFPAAVVPTVSCRTQPLVVTS